MAEFETAAEWQYSVVDLSDNSTTVYAGSCLYRGSKVTTALSAHDCPIKDDTTTIDTIPASAGVGTWSDLGDARVLTSLVVDPNDSATGMITVIYKPFHDGLAGNGALN